MKKNSLFFLATMFLALFHSQILSAQKLVGGFEAPESVIKYGDKIFVSNIGGSQPNPMAIDSNGFISELTADGKMIERKFSKFVLNGPKGLAIANKVLYVADINRVVGININSGAEVFELNIPEAAMLNDLCTIDGNTLAVSETIHNKVYLVHLSLKTYEFVGSINGANGVTYDPKSKQLFACGMGVQMDGKGKLYARSITSTDTLFTELPNSPMGIFDGLEMKDDEHLLLTDWVSTASNNKNGRFVVYDLKKYSSTTYLSSTGPADLYFDKQSQTIYLPEMLANSLLIVPIADLKSN